MSSALPPLEFFFDRNLGKETARRLSERGWVVHLISDVYANDAQAVSDEEWIAEGCRRGWVLLTKDKRIRYRGPELAAMHDGRLFCLANGNLRLDDMVERFDAAASRIRHAAGQYDRGFWQVYDDGRIERRWP